MIGTSGKVLETTTREIMLNIASHSITKGGNDTYSQLIQLQREAMKHIAN